MTNDKIMICFECGFCDEVIACEGEITFAEYINIVNDSTLLIPPLKFILSKRKSLNEYKSAH